MLLHITRNMRLSAEVYHEVFAIESRINDLAIQDSLLSSLKFKQIKYHHQHELQTYKMRIETLYSDLDCHANSIYCEACETDKVSLLRLSIGIEAILSDAKSHDYERYVQMGLKIKPKDPVFLSRKG